jgi:hypothetical protein
MRYTKNALAAALLAALAAFSVARATDTQSTQKSLSQASVWQTFIFPSSDRGGWLKAYNLVVDGYAFHVSDGLADVGEPKLAVNIVYKNSHLWAYVDPEEVDYNHPDADRLMLEHGPPFIFSGHGDEPPPLELYAELLKHTEGLPPALVERLKDGLERCKHKLHREAQGKDR